MNNDNKLVDLLDSLAIVMTLPEEGSLLSRESGFVNLRQYSDIDLNDMSYDEARIYVIKHIKSQLYQILVTERGKFRNNQRIIRGDVFHYADGKYYSQEYELSYQDNIFFIEDARFTLDSTYIDRFRDILPTKIQKPIQ